MPDHLLTNVPCMVCWPWNVLQILLISSSSPWKILAFLLGLGEKISLPPSCFFFPPRDSTYFCGYCWNNCELIEVVSRLLRKQENSWLMHLCEIKQCIWSSEFWTLFFFWHLWWMPVDHWCGLLTEFLFLLIGGTHVALDGLLNDLIWGLNPFTKQ